MIKACWLVDLWASSTLPRDLALVIAEDPPQNVAWLLLKGRLVKLA